MNTEPVVAKPLSFWQKIRSPEPNNVQIGFHFIFGVIAPLLCFIFDPGIFRSLGPCAPSILDRYAIFAYSASGLGMATLTLWLVTRSRLKHAAALMAGIFWAGTLFAAGLGLVLLPWSLIGLIVYGLGLLGLIPFLTASVFWRNGNRAWRLATQSNTPSSNQLRLAIATLGFIIVLGIPVLCQLQLPQLIPTLAYVEPAACNSD